MDRLRVILIIVNVIFLFAVAVWAEAKKRPAANVKPVVRARWISRSDGFWYCSHCGNEILFGIKNEPSLFGVRYCSGCGAEMQEEKNELDNHVDG